MFNDLFDELFSGVAGFGDTGRRVAKSVPVYRVEMPNGRGPYNSGLPNAPEIYHTLCAHKAGFNCARLAGLNHEQMGISDKAFRDAHGGAEYACLSPDAIRKWFPDPARDYLHTLDARIVEYEVPKGQYVLELGNGEVVFVRHAARRVREIDIVTVRVA